MKKKLAPICAFLVLAAFLASCANVRSSYTSEVMISFDEKEDYKSVEFLTHQPSRVALRIGSISSGGNGYAGFDDLVNDAKRKAAEMGGDFILVENSGVNTETVYSPGYSSYTANSNIGWGTSSGFGNGNAVAYSVGPSVYNVHRPWSKFSVWVYAPAQLGIRLDNASVISSFHLNSDAGKAGLKIGDKVIGIDDYDVMDEKIIHHLMTLKPGDRVKISLIRGSKQLERQITTLHNM